VNGRVGVPEERGMKSQAKNCMTISKSLGEGEQERGRRV